MPEARTGRRQWTLGAYLALAFSCLCVLLTLLLTAVVGRSASDGVSRSIGANLAELAGQTASRLDRGMFERHREIQLMAGRLGRLADWPAMQAELDAARQSYRYYAWLGVADARGVVRAASDGLLHGVDVSARPWFRGAREGQHLGDVHEAALLANALRGQDAATPRFFDVAFTLRGEPGAPVLGAHVSWEWAHDVRQVIFGKGAAAVEPLIVSEQGVVLLGPPGLEGRALQVGSLARAQRGEQGHVIEQWPDGQRYLVGFAPTRGYLTSPGLGWKVLVRQELGVAYEPLRRLQSHVLAWGVTLTALFSLLGWLVARAVSRPVLALADTARRLEHDNSIEVRPPRSYREVEMLGGALASLLATVRSQTGELHRLNADLEQRVEQRTAELRGAYERVRASEQRIHTIIESAQDPFIGMDLAGRLTDWSGRAQEVFGWSREEAVGRRVGELLMAPGHAGALEGALEAFRQTGRSPLLEKPFEWRMRDRGGREIPVEVRVALAHSGGERFFSAFVHDISERKEVERMKDEFISTVSHELRTPLTAIYGSLSLLDSGAAGELPADARQLLAISHQSTERLIRLINDMLDLEKLASGHVSYHMERRALRPLLAQAVRDTQPYATRLGVRLRLAEGDDAQVEVDADRLLQVCVNLLSNGAKFSPEGGEVEVALAIVGGRARVSVVDQGPGIPPEFRHRIFERFAQAAATDRRAQGGTGLGLSISRNIVEAHGGRIGFDSRPGVRTEFFFELPLAAA